MKRILLLEPDKVTADIIVEYLQKHSFPATISRVETSQEAVHMVDDIQPDLVICELAIPQHNGLAFLHEFRSYPEWNSVPVLIHSMIPQEETGLDASDLQRIGVVKYLYKPNMSLDKLHRTLKELLET